MEYNGVYQSGSGWMTDTGRFASSIENCLVWCVEDGFSFCGIANGDINISIENVTAATDSIIFLLL